MDSSSTILISWTWTFRRPRMVVRHEFRTIRQSHASNAARSRRPWQLAPRSETALLEGVARVGLVGRDRQREAVQTPEAGLDQQLERPRVTRLRSCDEREAGLVEAAIARITPSSDIAWSHHLRRGYDTEMGSFDRCVWSSPTSRRGRSP